MKLHSQINFGLIISLSLLFCILTGVTVVYAQPNSDDEVVATVKIGICGDGVADGDEECDGNDLREFSCREFGYAEGQLQCDKACEFSFSECEVDEFTILNNDPFSVVLSIFDFNKSGKIENCEMIDILKLWVSKWNDNTDPAMCDIDLNGLCNLVDLSLLLYYVGR